MYPDFHERTVTISMKDCLRRYTVEQRQDTGVKIMEHSRP
jgi:hypothetical protein